MRTMQCSRCIRYRGGLTCDAFPSGIPEDILTGAVDHTKPYANDRGKRFKEVPGTSLLKSVEDGVEANIEATNKIVRTEDKAYNRAKDVLIRKGYVDSDFEEGGPLYGYSTNELIDLARAV